MILVLDTNILTGDLAMRGPVFKVLAQRAHEGSISVIVPAVSYEETAANWRRELTTRQTELRSWIKKCRTAGVEFEFRHLEKTLETANHNCHERLTALLDALGAELAPHPPVEHATLVSRAARRIKPCDSNGDGYRDTLVWYTVLECAKADPEEDVVLVSEDGDFADSKGSIHPELQRELHELDMANVRLARRLDRFVAAEILLQNSAGDGQVRKSLQQDYRNRIVDMLADTFSFDLIGEAVSPKDAGLPRGTSEATVSYVEELHNFQERISAALDDSSRAVEFSVEANCGLDLSIDADSAEEHGLIVRDALDKAIVQVNISKTLIIEGLLTSDSLFAQFSTNILHIKALPDDPGLWEWAPPDDCFRWADE